MIETVTDAITALQTEAAAYPATVRTWMQVMAISFFAGIVFVPWRRGALWIVAAAAATWVALVFAKMLWPDLARADAGTVVHLVLWPVALVALWRAEALHWSLSLWTLLYNGWSIWVTALMLTSLVLDGRSLVSWFA